MKLNKKEANRTLHAKAAGDGVVMLYERLAYPGIFTNKKKWEEDRIILTVQEVLRLYNNLEKILKPAEGALKQLKELKKDGTR